LHDAGYETAICGKWHLGEFQPEYRPTQRGFDHQYGQWFGAIDYFTHERDGVLDWHRDDQPSKDEGYSTHLLAKEACRTIREHSSEKPLFLYLPFNAVHAPHQVPEKYLAPYQQLKGTRRTYAGMVAAMDEAIGQVVAALEEKGLKENTLILFSSDNGGPSPGKITDNGPYRAGKGTLYEGGVRVCAFANWPGHIAAGQTIREPIHMVDWYPTLLKLAAASAEQSLTVDGLDVWPVLTAQRKTPHDAILLCGMRGPYPVALRAGDWKLLVGASDVDAESAPDVAKSTSEKVELYNLADDPGEKTNLAAEQPQRVQELRSRLATLLAGAVQPGNPADSGTAPSGRVKKVKRKPAL
jgi:arylsulfatase A-like enzyme